MIIIKKIKELNGKMKSARSLFPECHTFIHETQFDDFLNSTWLSHISLTYEKYFDKKMYFNVSQRIGYQNM